jgi:hypothetical protein
VFRSYGFCLHVAFPFSTIFNADLNHIPVAQTRCRNWDYIYELNSSCLRQSIRDKQRCFGFDEERYRNAEKLSSPPLGRSMGASSIRRTSKKQKQKGVDVDDRCHGVINVREDAITFVGSSLITVDQWSWLFCKEIQVDSPQSE